MRLIDADELKKEIASLVVDGERRIYEVMPRCGGEWVDGVASAYRTIDDAPMLDLERTIDEAFSNGYRAGTLDAISDSEQPKGKWIQRCDDNFDWYECSCCGYGDEGELQKRPWFRFCPYCGTKMKGGKNEIN